MVLGLGVKQKQNEGIAVNRNTVERELPITHHDRRVNLLTLLIESAISISLHVGGCHVPGLNV